MPDVWRNNYKVTGSSEGRFTLSHLSEQYSEFETLDIILSELSLPYVKSPPPLLNSTFDRLAKRRKLDGQFLRVAHIYFEHFRENIVESPVMATDGYVAATGVTLEEFERFRAALFAIASVCQGMAMAYRRRLHLRPNSAVANSEHVEWRSVNWISDFFLALLGSISAISQEKIDCLIPLFSIDFREDAPPQTHAADGYFPPIARIEDSFVFNPSLLQRFLPARNILYAINKLDSHRFDNIVSKYMEPELLSSSIKFLSRIDGCVIQQNVNWKHGGASGEMDILVYSPAENVALHVQAKAAIAPQGARMTRALEARIEEGIVQLDRFRQLDQTVIDSIVGNRFGQAIKNVRIVDVMLTRSSCGTARVWERLSNIVVANVGLLASAFRQAKVQNRPIMLSSFHGAIIGEIARIKQAIKPEWIRGNLSVFGAVISVPILDYHESRLYRERSMAFEEG
jgi:hypothetical protein